LRSSAPALFNAIASTLTNIKKEEHDGNVSETKNNGAILSLKHAREPLDLAKALVKANLHRSSQSSSEKGAPLTEEAQSMIASIAATSQVAKESIQQLCKSILKDAGVEVSAEENDNRMIDAEKSDAFQNEEDATMTDITPDAQIEKKKRKKVKT
jgi:hypothetical protein